MTRRMPITRMFREKVVRDAKFVENRAAAVLIIGENGIDIKYNLNAVLGIIGILGPGVARGYHFSRAVLEEIGLGPTKPFHKGKIPELLQKKGCPKAITYRHREFKLTINQYLAVAPMVFEMLQQFTDKRVAGWEGGPYFKLPGRKYRYNRAQEVLQRFDGMFESIRGAHFSVSIESLFARDVFWAEQNLNLAVIKLARLINMRLGHRLERWRGRKAFLDLKRTEEIKEIISKSLLSKYLLIASLSHLPGGEANPFVPHLRQILEWQGGMTAEGKFALCAPPNQKSRLKGMQLWVTAGLEREMDYITFEVLPSSRWKDFAVTAPLDSADNEQIPF